MSKLETEFIKELKKELARSVFVAIAVILTLIASSVAFYFNTNNNITNLKISVETLSRGQERLENRVNDMNTFLLQSKK